MIAIFFTSPFMVDFNYSGKIIISYKKMISKEAEFHL